MCWRRWEVALRFRDEIQIDVKAGDGGHGRVSFRHEKYVPKGGPDGGDGGDGGDVVFLADDRLMSLESLAKRRRYAAADGKSGGSSRRFCQSVRLSRGRFVPASMGTTAHPRE